MSSNGIDVVGQTTQTTVSENQIDQYEHGDQVQEGDYVAVTDEGIYEVPGNAREADIAEALDAENVKKVQYNGERDMRTSASAVRVDDFGQLDELARMTGCPFDVLDGQVQEREGQSTDTVYQSDYANDPIDKIE